MGVQGTRYSRGVRSEGVCGAWGVGARALLTWPLSKQSCSPSSLTLSWDSLRKGAVF